MKTFFTIKIIENNPKYYSCPHCNYSTNKTSNYKYHLKFKHSDELILFLQSEINKSDKTNNIASKSLNENGISTIVKTDKISKYSIYIFEPNEESPKEIDKFSILKNVFDNSNHLNKYDEELGNFHIHTSKIINSGAFSTSYLDEGKKIGFKVIILKTNLKY